MVYSARGCTRDGSLITNKGITRVVSQLGFRYQTELLKLWEPVIIKYDPQTGLLSFLAVWKLGPRVRKSLSFTSRLRSFEIVTNMN